MPSSPHTLMEKKPNVLPSRSNAFGCWKWLRPSRAPQCVVCIHVHQVSGLPSPMKGHSVVVGWKSRGCKGEQTLPADVGTDCMAATFDEVFLHYCRSNDVEAVLKSFTIWVSLVDAVDYELGKFVIDLRVLQQGCEEGLDTKLGGKKMSFDLGGVASGGILSISVYCRVIEVETHVADLHVHKQSKSRCFSCLPILKCHRIWQPCTIPGRRVLSLRSDPAGFITIENTFENQSQINDEDDDDEEEEKGFITIEKGIVNTDKESVDVEDDEKLHLVINHDLKEEEQFDVDRVEDEFLRTLEETSKLSLDLGLETLVREAEVEMTKAAQVWKSRVVAALLEREEFEELKKKWESSHEEGSSSGCFSVKYGFGSPL